MVDKIDRTEAPPTYFITRPKDAKESQHEQKERQGEEEQRRQKEIAEKEWTKFDRRTTVIRPLRAPRDMVARCLFRGVFLHSGVGTLQVDVIWKDGRRTDGALVLLTRLEDYLRLKKFAPGQDVPEEFWARGGQVELGIIQVIAAGTPPTRQTEGAEETRSASLPRRPLLETFGILGGGRVNWAAVAAYIIFTAVAVLIVVAAVR